MNFLVVLGFDLLFVNLDVFFVKSPKTTKAPIFFVRFQNWYGLKTAHARKTPQTPANQKKTLFGLGGRAKLLETA